MTNEVRVISYIIGSDSDYYNLHHFTTFSVPTADNLFLLILSILALESAHSIRFLYQHFLSRITEKSLNVFYYACSYAKVDHSRFMNTTVRIVLKLIPDSLQTQPVFLCVDDTMVSKFGTKFENVSKLFDHAAHNGSNYLNGHCFVSVMLCVPVWNNQPLHRNMHNKIHSVISPLFRIKNADTETGWNVQILRSVWIISAEIRYLLSGQKKFQNKSKNIDEVYQSVFFRCIMFLSYRVTFLCNVLKQCWGRMHSKSFFR